MIWRFSGTSNPTAATEISTQYGCVLSFVSGLPTRYWTDFMSTPPTPNTRSIRCRLCVEDVAARKVINRAAGGAAGGSCSISTAKPLYVSVRCRSTECSNFLDAFGDGFRQLHHLLAQRRILLNLALEAFAIDPQLFPQSLKLANKIVNFTH